MIKSKIKIVIFTLMILLSSILISGCISDYPADTTGISDADAAQGEQGESYQGNGPGLDSNGDETGQPEEVYTFDDAPVQIIRENVTEFTLPGGDTHWYETVYLPEGGVNWIQAKNLAEEAGGYLVSIHSDEENEFVFSLIDDEKYWFVWREGEDTEVTSGPFIGAYQPEGSEEPDGGWKWISGEEWTYSNWAEDGMAGDEDPRPNDQPNNANGNQNIAAFGEITIRVSTWGDFPQKMSSYNDENEAQSYGFIIEYDKKPATA